MGFVCDTNINRGRPFPDDGCAQVPRVLAESQLVALAADDCRLGFSIGELLRRVIAAGLEAPGVGSEALEQICGRGRARASELRLVNGNESIVPARPRKTINADHSRASLRPRPSTRQRAQGSEFVVRLPQEKGREG
jgi:hypothetical protein